MSESQPCGRYECLRPAQIEAIRRRTPIAYVPWGSLEWHGRHNPIGLDGLKAHALCKALAEQTGGVVLPTMYAGADTIKPFKGFHHTLDHAASTVKTLCTELLEQLADEQFKVIIVLTGHYSGGQVKAVEEAAHAFAGAHPEVSVWAFPDWVPHEGVFPPNHAAHGETSYMLQFHGELVDLSQLPPDREATLEQDGVWGEDPRRASAEAGEAMVRVFLDRALPRIRELLARHGG